MPAFYMDATLYTLDAQRFNQLLKKWQGEIMKVGVKKFLIAALKRIPARTGFLRGAFSQIRREFAGSNENLNPVLAELFADDKLFRERERVKDAKVSAAGKAARDKALHAEILKGLRRQNKGRAKTGSRLRMVEYYYSGVGKGAKKIAKTPRSGIPFATKPADVLKFTDNVATFFIDVSISYYRINDNYSKIKGSPWHSMMEGGSVMANWLGRAADLFPGITEILTLQKIVLRGSRITQGKTGEGVVASRLLSIRGFDFKDSGEDIGPPPPAQPRTDSKVQLQRARLMANRQAKKKGK